MFVPCEGIGSAVAKIMSECGLRPLKMEFYEDRAVVEFSSADNLPPSSSRTPVRNGHRPIADVPKGTCPEGPWEKGDMVGNSRVWKCGDVTRTLKEISSAYGVEPGCMEYRLRTSGYATTRRKKSKFERTNTRKRMSLSDK